jgi:hypothetical protein
LHLFIIIKKVLHTHRIFQILYKTLLHNSIVMSTTAKNRFQSTKSTTQDSASAETPSAIPADIYRIVRDLVLFFCRRIIFGPAKFKLIVSFIIILVGSLLKTLQLAPNSYLSMKTNIFNTYFAKLGWAWTMGLLIPFVYFTLITTHSQYRIIIRHLSRLLIATGVWYIITLIFVRVESYTGMCKHVDMKGVSRRVCVGGGHEWEEGHDFSGHTFLLLYALLIINEEVKAYDKGTTKVDHTNGSGDTSSPTINQKLISKIVRVLYVSLAALTILWEFMLLSTALYFHHTLHKLIAAGLAVFFWYITYYVWYRPDSTSVLHPSSPKD